MTDEAKALVERLEEWEWTLRAAYKGGDLGTDEPALLMGEAADRIEELDRHLTLSGKVSKALSERIEALEAENERLQERLAEAYQIAGHIAVEYDGNGKIERLLDLLAGINLGDSHE